MSDLDLDALEKAAKNPSAYGPTRETVLALIAKAREAEGLRIRLASARKEIYEQDEDKDVLTADLATACAQLATAREALIRISDYMNKHTMTGTVARETLSQLPEASK